MDPGVAGSVAAALWCLVRFQLLERERPGPRRSLATRLRGSALRWAGAAVMLGGAAACLIAGCAFAALARPHPVAALLYCALCVLVLALLVTVEALTLAYRLQARKEAAKRRRRASVRTLMRGGPISEVPL
jgi:uncharacterized membrane protein YfcA